MTGWTGLIICLVALLATIWLAMETALFNWLTVFIFLGVIPGTDIVIPAWLTIIIAIVLSICLIAWLKSQPLYIGDMNHQEKTARQLARARVAHKTAKLTKVKPTDKARSRRRFGVKSAS